MQKLSITVLIVFNKISSASYARYWYAMTGWLQLAILHVILSHSFWFLSVRLA